MDRLKNLKLPEARLEDISSPDDNDNEDIVDDLSQKSKKRKKHKHKHHRKKSKKSSPDKSPTLSFLDFDRLSPSSLNFRGSPEGEKRLREKLTQKLSNMSRDNEDSFIQESISPNISIKSAVVMKENDKNRKSRDSYFYTEDDHPSTSYSKPQQPSSVVSIVKNRPMAVAGRGAAFAGRGAAIADRGAAFAGRGAAVDLRQKIDRNYRSIDNYTNFSPQPIRERRLSNFAPPPAAPAPISRRQFSQGGPQKWGRIERDWDKYDRFDRSRSPIGRPRSSESRDYPGDYNSNEEYYKTEDFVKSKKLSSPPPDHSNSEKTSQKNMPEHIKWLHDRWARYDHPSFFSTSHTLKPVDFSNKQQQEKSRDAEDYKNWRQNANSDVKNKEIYQKSGDFQGKSADFKVKPAAHWSGFKQKPRRPPPKQEPPHPSRFKQTSDYFNWMYGGRSRDEIPHLLTFKEFLMSFPDNDSHVTGHVTAADGHVDEEKEQQKLINLYNEYKLKFKRRVFYEFFEQHKDEEWFLEKYHPTYRIKRDRRRRECVQKRLDVFMYLLVRGWLEVHAEYTDSRKVRKLLDAACVLLEGGKEEDIILLSDFDYILEEKREESYEVEHQEDLESGPESGSAPEQYGLKIDISKKDDENSSKTKKDEGEIEENLDFMMKRDEDILTNKKKEDTTLEIMQHAKDYTLYVKQHTQAIELPPQEVRDMPDNIIETRLETSYVGQGVFVSKPKFFTENNKCLSETSLHKSASLCLRDLSPKISRSELIEICADAHGGFTRLSLSDPDPKRNFVRQGIVSFWNNANLMKICWVLRGKYLSTRQKLTVIEYRDFFSKRIATVDGLSADKSIVLRDIQLCKSLVEFLDRRHNLWDDSENDTPSVPKVNPLLVNLNECLTFHLQQLLASGEITDLSDVNATAGSSEIKQVKPVDRDENLVRILDRLIMYLRIVHSVDYYGCKFYEKEDDEPRRIGLVHLRGPSHRQATPKKLANYIQEFEEKLHHLLPSETRLADEHVELLGMKKPETEIDKFISDNIIATSRDSLAKCCFCYKRFTSKDFAVQHVQQRHVDKIDEFKLELTAFNNYLYDPNRLCHVQFT